MAKGFFVLVKKEFIHIVRDRWTALILFLLPVIMLMLFGYALNTEVTNTAIVVCDPSNDQITTRIVEALGQSPYFRIVRLIGNVDDIDGIFRRGEAKLAIVFGGNFSENIFSANQTQSAEKKQAQSSAQIGLIADATDPNAAISRVMYATGVIRTACNGIFSAPAHQYAIVPSIRFLHNPAMKSSFNFVPGVMGMILMLICAMMTSVSIVREKENGTMEVLLVSPLRPIAIIASKVIPFFAFSCVNLASIVLLGVFVLGVPIAGSMLALISISVLFIIVALSLGLFISTIAETQLVAILMSIMGLLMPVMLLSGMIFPVANMPIALQVISDILPARWYISAIRKIMIQGRGFTAITRETVILLSMACLLILVSMKKFKMRLE